MSTDLRKRDFRKRLSNVYRKSDLGYYLVRPFYLIYEFILKMIPDEAVVRSSFKKHMGYSLDLENPTTLNEKINWLKLYHRKKIHTTIADKFKVRAYIKEKIGEQYLIPLLYETKNPDDIRPENLPDINHIIKCNHDSTGGVIVIDKSNIDWKRTRRRFRRLLKLNHYVKTREWQYKNIEPRIIVEKLITNADGSIPDDYKIHCFHGKVVFFGVDVDRHLETRGRNLYDTNWNLLPCNWGRPNGRDLPKPENLDEMITLAEKLAKDFIYLRVDFYSVEGRTYFGELTLHQSSGFRKFWQKECDEKFGKLLNLKSIKKP
ncbi:ATP-grasp fold amidoligase family protein [Winogradskyella ursingii]|uniref:ATP-grasp fold amidoligase family protein n=1 Tax=Winogradskyella ursingii TaxID=2686079 RepID=UPI0015C8457A|nr:ATP-grasp fold amidoligase family protein [Winogradskyella ursingii]